MKKFILASNSPRRKELLRNVIADFDIISSTVDEVIEPDMPYEEMVMDLAFQKASDVFKSNRDAMVLGFDTLVLVDNELLGKPKSKEEAKKMLQKLSGKTHFVLTGCALISKEISTSFYEKTRVNFYELTEEEIDNYIETGEPMDKAGAYGIQGYGSKFISGIVGDYFTVMGMPISKLYHELKGLKLI